MSTQIRKHARHIAHVYVHKIHKHHLACAFVIAASLIVAGEVIHRLILTDFGAGLLVPTFERIFALVEKAEL